MGRQQAGLLCSLLTEGALLATARQTGPLSTHGTSQEPWALFSLCTGAVEFHTPPPRVAANPKMTFVQEKKEKP